MEKDYDFSGWATVNGLRCSDGRIIRHGAFSMNNGEIVPLVWNHQHNDPRNVLGHAVLEEREEGMYAYAWLNDSENGKLSRELLSHGDIRCLSIWANELKHNGADVIHGNIREVSLVHSGANPGAKIDSVLTHGEDFEEEGTITTGTEIELAHSSDEVKDDNSDTNTDTEVEAIESEKDTTEPDTLEHADQTLGEMFDSLTDSQKELMYAMVGLAIANNKKEEGDDDDMKHNVFEDAAKKNEGETKEVLSHSEMAEIFADVKRYGTLKESVLAHGIDNIEYLFPEAKTLNTPPDWISREMGWVREVMSRVHKTPFSRIKSMFADITEDDARAKGYIKGKLKKEEVFSLLKRTTTPTTIYKKQKLDRDDVIDITDFDVVAWLKSEMRVMLDEEIARAILVSDGRLSSSDDKINETNIRPIYNDADLYTIKVKLTSAANATSEDVAKDFIKAVIKSRKSYKGSGNPTLYTTEDMLTDMLLIEDGIGRALYEDETALARKLRVSKIVTVPVMEGAKGVQKGNLLGIIVNLADYNVGADRGGAVNMFDDFDIDYNAQKYLIETRCSGALIKPYSAIAIEDATTTSGE